MTSIVTTESPKLIAKLESYLSGAIGHDEISEYAWTLTDHSKENPPKNERPFWSAVFTIIHLADEAHWNDGCTEKP